MNHQHQTIHAHSNLLPYKTIELNNEKNVKFFMDKHSTKEGTWGNLTVTEGNLEFVFLDGQGQELARHSLNSDNPTLRIPPASWHRILSTSPIFKATIVFSCQEYRYFEKKYQLNPMHGDLHRIYNTYLSQTEQMSILDIGCGSGRNPLSLALKGHKVLGIDRNAMGLDNISNIAHAENLTNVETILHDLNEPLPINQKFDFIYSTVTLQFLQPSTITPLLETLQHATNPGGMHFLVFPIQKEPFTYPGGFTYLPEERQLYEFYQDNGWSLLEYHEKPGQLHKLDETGKPIQGVFAQLLAQKHI